MKLLDKECNSAAGDDCASQILATIPMVMHAVISEMRGQRPTGLSLPQFRALAFLRHHENESLSELAEHFGLTLPTISKLIDGLVKRGYVERETSSSDRRCVVLKLTENGKSILKAAGQAARAWITEMLKTLSLTEQKEVIKAMDLLQHVFMNTSVKERSQL